MHLSEIISALAPPTKSCCSRTTGVSSRCKSAASTSLSARIFILRHLRQGSHHGGFTRAALAADDGNLPVIIRIALGKRRQVALRNFERFFHRRRRFGGGQAIENLQQIRA